MGLSSAEACCWLSCGSSGAGCAGCAAADCPNGPGLLPIKPRMTSNSNAPPATPAAVAIAVRRKPPPAGCGATAACNGERVGDTGGAVGAAGWAPHGPILGALPRKPDDAGAAP